MTRIITFEHLNFKELVTNNLRDYLIISMNKKINVNNIPPRNNIYNKVKELLTFSSDNIFYNLLDTFYKNKILNSLSIQTIINNVDGDISISSNGYISSNDTKICKIHTWALIRDIAVAVDNIGYINYLDSKNILTNKNIYKPFVDELEKKKISFKISLFSEKEEFINFDTEYCNKIFMLKENINLLYLEYGFLYRDKTNWEIGIINNFEITDELKVNIINKGDLIIKKENIDSLLMTPAIKIFLSLNKCLKIDSFKTFKTLLNNIKILEKIIESSMVENSNEIKTLDLTIGLGEEDTITIDCNCPYKKDLYTGFQCDADVLIKLNYNELIYQYYLSDYELQKIYLFEEFKGNIIDAFKNMAMMNY